MSNTSPGHPTRKTGRTTIEKQTLLRKTSVGPQPITGEQRRMMIAEAAYYIAERRGFESGHEIEDWLLAESQLAAALRRDKSPP